MTPSHPPTTSNQDRHLNTRHSRRGFLAAVGAGTLTAAAGCTDGNAATPEPVPEPIALDGGKRDDLGGMTIGEHFGPNGQVFYRDHSPKGHENPAWFHTLTAGLFPYHFERQRRGWEAVAIYVTDYSRVDSDLVTESGDTFISTHTAADTFGPADEALYVAGSAVLGGMGKELIPFSVAADAERFAEEHDGETVEFETITPEWLGAYLAR